MHTITEIHGHEVIDMVAANPGGMCANALARLVAQRFGKAARFRTCSAAGMDFDELLVFLDTRDKLRVTGDMVFPGRSPACGN